MDFHRALRPHGGATYQEALGVFGLVAGVVILIGFYVQDYEANARRGRAEQDLRVFAKALTLFDQLEGNAFAAPDGDLRGLIGKYLPEYRTSIGQVKPRDPWGQDYRVIAAEGTIVSAGPDGTMDTPLAARAPKNDDLMTLWKPGFYILYTQKLQPTLIEVTFTRRIADGSVPPDAVVGLTNARSGFSLAKNRISDTVYRFTVPEMSEDPTGHRLNLKPLTAQDGKNAWDRRPDGTDGGVIVFQD